MDSAYIQMARVDLDTDVEETLLRVRRDLLPEEISKSWLSDWILDFDSLAKDRFQLDRTKEQSDDPFASVISATVESSLSPNIAFYFSSLFHIGRQWQVSSYALDSIGSALMRDNLKESVSRNVDSFRMTLSSLDVSRSDDDEVVSTLLQEALSFAREQHQQKIEVARGYWELWQNEVRELVEVVQKCTEDYNSYSYERQNEYRNYGRRDEYRSDFPSIPSLIILARFSYRAKALYRSLTEDGVEFKEPSSSQESPGSLLTNKLMPLIITALGDERMRHELRELMHDFATVLHIQKELSSSQDSAGVLAINNLISLIAAALGSERLMVELHHVFRELTDVFRAQQEALKAQTVEPVVRDVQSKLLKLFIDKDPFENYSVLSCPPDKELAQLWMKCLLPNGEAYHYAKLWKKLLEGYAVSSYSSPQFKSQLDHADIESYAISADCTIKLGWVSSDTKRAGQTDKERIQQLFENKWILGMVNSIFYTAREKSVKPEWTLTHFTELARKVIEFLSKYGYSLTLPTPTRLELLWKKSSKSHVYDSTEW